ncbi:hypothetical protein EBZ39_04875 [bacterium]|nr:hypothetical protein [bacterium]
MGAVNISLANGQLGATAQQEDGIVGMVLTGGVDGYTLGEALLVTSVANAVTQGLTATGSPFAYRQVVDFYKLAGAGAKLYLMLCENTLTLVDMTAADGPAHQLLEYAGGKIKVLGVMTDDTDVYGGSVVVSAGINADVAIAKTNLGILAGVWFAKQQPFRAIIGGTSYAGVPGDLADQLTGSNNRVAILIGDTDSAPGDARDQCCLGLLLGDVAKLPVQRKVSRVANGELPINVAYVGSIAVGSVGHAEDHKTIETAGYITFATYSGQAGYYFSPDYMACAGTDDYAFLCRGRIVDKMHRIAYSVFVQRVDDEVKINEDGTLDNAFCVWLQTQMENAINTAMVAKGELSSVNCYIDPSQNILSTNELNVALTGLPVGYASTINVVLGFTNPAV